ncbi:MAG: tetratricopeptide repeat protein [Nitrospirae bacterium]|nr:tetratricopeptide repeat protein [Nitrospirota bacterium]
MSNKISVQSLSQLSELISSLMGLHFPESRWNDLEHGIESASTEFGFNDSEAFIRWLQSSPLERMHVEKLASHLTVGETYFFREGECFKVLEERILPELIALRQDNERRLRIWSTGCSTGEEAYSIAILLNKMVMDRGDWDITLLATDINPRSLKKASEGLYTEWSFRDTPSWIRELYFRQREKGLYEIIPSIRKMVTFTYLNLVEDVYPSLLNNTNAMDVISCRNVLMYFTPRIARKVVKGLYNSLMDGGRLLLSPTDAVRPLPAGFVPVRSPGITLYRKDSQRAHHVDELIPPIPPLEKGGISEYPFLKGGIPEYLPVEKGVNISPPLSVLNGHVEPEVSTLLARVYANQGRLDEAVKWCEKSIAADKVNPDYYYLLATILQEQGDVESAIKALKRAIYLDHNFILAYFLLGNLKLKQGDTTASRRYFKNVSSLLEAYKPEDELPGSEGITAGRLAEIIESMNTYGA